jgi:glycosyltransferase involved in cell wall biosynthesis
MVCRDGLPYLPATLESLTSQTFDDWELVFWDNGSRDGSADLARALGTRARVLGGSEILTLGEARRRVVEESRGRYVALLDADDLWRADKLQRQVERMSRGDVGLCYSDCHVVASDGRRLGRYSHHSRPAAGRVRQALILENFIPTCTVMVARNVWRAVGGPDPRLNAAVDYELWLRVAAVSDIAHDPEPLASYRVHPGGLTSDFEDAYEENRGIYQDLLADNAGGVPGEHALARRALASLLWKWAGRELLAGSGPEAVARHCREAWSAAHGPGQALSDLVSCAVRNLRGFGLRIAMHRER